MPWTVPLFLYLSPSMSEILHERTVGVRTYSFHAEPVMYPRTIASRGKTLSDRICMQRPRRAALSEGVTTSGAAGGSRLTTWCFRPGMRESRTLNQWAWGEIPLARESAYRNRGVKTYRRSGIEWRPCQEHRWRAPHRTPRCGPSRP